MNKKDQKFGFARRDAYDVSQRSLSLNPKSESGSRDSGNRRVSAKESSYNAEPPSKAVLRRIKLR
jgi:hypothetical protein